MIGFGSQASTSFVIRAQVIRSLWLYSITSSARSRTDSGILNPNAAAVFILTTSSSRLACSTGRSAGFVPFRMRSTKIGQAPRRVEEVRTIGQKPAALDDATEFRNSRDLVL